MTNYSITVRESTSLDADRVNEVEQLASQDLRKIYRLGAVFSRGPRSLFSGQLVAEIEDQLVGTVRYRRVGDRLHLYNLMVHPNYRRIGVARQLIEAAGVIALQSGASLLSLYTIEQTGNVTIFDKLGFQVIDRSPAHDLESVTGEPLTEVYLEKLLSDKG